MEINRNRSNLAKGSVASKKTKGATTGKSPRSSGKKQTNSGDANDTLSLTDRATELQALENHIAELPEVNINRVETVKSAIRDGSHKINPPRVAERLLNAEVNLIFRKTANE